MGRRLLLAPLVTVVALLNVATGSAADVQTSAKYVRSAIPAIEAYAADHGGYKGLTLAGIRKWDKSVRNITIRTATRRTYCIQSTMRPFAHKAGPGAPVSTGRCGVRGREIPFTPPPSNQPKLTTAEQRIRGAVPALEAYWADHGTYAGATLAELRRYDSSIADVTIVRTAHDTYCIESGSGAEQFHKNGPGDPIAPGPCAAA